MKKSCKLIHLLWITGVLTWAGTASAGELCYSELKHAYPGRADAHSMLSIGMQQAPVMNGMQQSASAPLKRYQKPVLSDKGACLYKPAGFKSVSIKM